MWFAAKLLFESSMRDKDGRVLHEESIRLVQSSDQSQAESKGNDLGLAEEHEYPNEHGEMIRWRFIGVVEIQDLGEKDVSDGMEVFSTLKWTKTAGIPLEVPCLAADTIASGQTPPPTVTNRV